MSDLNSVENIDVSSLSHQQQYEEKAVTESFIDEYIGMVRSISGKLIHSGSVPKWIEFEDLVSWGIEGLIKARKNFNANIETKFQTYAFYRIKGEILDCVRKEWAQKNSKEYYKERKKMQDSLSNVVDMTLSESTGTADQVVSDVVSNTSFVRTMSNKISSVIAEKKGMKNPEEEIIDESNEELWQEINTLTDIERQVVELVYVNDLKQMEVASHLGMSPSSVSRIHYNLILKLKKRFKKKEEFI